VTVSPTAVLTLDDLNAMDEDAFAGALAGVFEHSPWVARAAHAARPFASVDDLQRALEAAMRAAPRARQLDLIRAHPELAGREASAGALTEESAGEQARAGLDRLTADELRALRALNASYRARFGFPFVVCVREHTKESILASGGERLRHATDAEVAIALGEIAKIAGLRLGDLVASSSEDAA
jgi:2-oxo-4-hydroxy-4-carboxy-5-ureidoimidazoline decarboxylase